MDSNSPSSLLKSVAEYAAFNNAEKQIDLLWNQENITKTQGNSVEVEKQMDRVRDIIYKLLTTNPDFYIRNNQDKDFCMNFYK
jgi:hypothetical protein